LVALADAKKGIAMFGQAQLKVPVIGLVENMSYFTPAEDHCLKTNTTSLERMAAKI
jgi:Mrp family chromosome partitioning ATPase